MPSHKRILIVEDQPLIALDLQVLLEDNDYEPVDWASNIQTVRKIIDNTPPDVALVDFMLEAEPADSLVDVLAGKGIPFAFCTGSDARELLAQHPLVPILSKPYVPEDVLSTIAKLLAGTAET